MTKDDALKLALEALGTLMIERGSIYDKAISAIKEALAQPEQEPVACIEYVPCCTDQTCPKCKAATPPQRLPLTDEAKDAARYRWIRDSGTDVSLVIDKRTEWVPPDDVVAGVGGYWMYEYRCGSELDEAIDQAIEAKLKEKNT